MASVEDVVPPLAMASTSMRIVSSFSGLFFFLWIGHLLREKIVALRRIMLPASLIGGLVALLVIQVCSFSKTLAAVIAHDWIVGWKTLPGFLNNIVFSTLFLGSRIPSVKEIVDTAAPQIAYGWFLAWGCWLTVCSVNAIVLMRIWNTDILFSTLGPIGFTGGHGTAGGMGDSYTAFGFPAGGDLGLTSATIGILYGVVVGTVLVNIANQKGWTYKSYKESNPVDCEKSLSENALPVDMRGEGEEAAPNIDVDDTVMTPASAFSPISPRLSDSSPRRRRKSKSGSVASGDEDGSQSSAISRSASKNRQSCDDMRSQPVWRLNAIIPTDKRVSAGDITVSSDAIETLALHVCYIAGCLMLAYWTKRGLIAIEGTNAWLTQYAFFTGFPVFPLCLMWGIVIQVLINRVCDHSPLSRGMIERIGGISLDVLVLSAIATTNLSAVASQIVPLLILCTSLLIWQVLAFFIVAPRMLPDFWVERSLGEFGVGTATTSIGLMLMRSIDPQFETPAVRAFAAKQLFTEPLMGGGLITSLMLPLIKSLGNFVVAGIAAGVMTFILALWFFLLRKHKLGPTTQYKFIPENNRFM